MPLAVLNFSSTFAQSERSVRKIHQPPGAEDAGRIPLHFFGAAFLAIASAAALETSI